MPPLQADARRLPFQESLAVVMMMMVMVMMMMTSSNKSWLLHQREDTRLLG